MPTCVPVANNNVTDVNANKPAPPGTNDSKLTRIMQCLFFKKKTNVVDMKKDIGKNQKLTVDRSERSRRVLKMESTTEAPVERDPADADNKPRSSGPKQMFLPSENPTASFLSYINPTVRRACSDVIKSSTDNVKPKSKEAFVTEARIVRSRNTNYRGQQRASDRGPIGLGVPGSKPPKLPPRSQSQSKPVKKPIVVPGIMTGSDDDVGYNSNNDIHDLHEEIRRMNHSHPDLRNALGPHGRPARRREGSISLSESSSSSDDEESEEIHRVIQNRPQNPGPEDLPETRIHPQRQSPNMKRSTKPSGANKTPKKKKPMENAIDALFQQTQNNLDSIYQNGLEQLEEIDTFRAETATPETCMRRLDEQLGEPSDEGSTPNTNGAFVNRTVPVNENEKHKSNERPTNKTAQENGILEEYVPEMDGLLSDVSVWAKDRQTWLLSDNKREDLRREDTSATFNDRMIDRVSRSNDDKCTEWVERQNREVRETPRETPVRETPVNHNDTKVNGILTGPRLFRSTSKTPYSQRRVSLSSGSGDADQNKPSDNQMKEESFKPFSDNNMKYSGNTMNKDGLLIGNSTNIVSLGSLPGFGRQPKPPADEDNFSLMYCDDRSTIDDNLSEMDHPPNYRPRSPDSWISSVVSYHPNRANQTIDSHNDSFEGAIPSASGNREKQPSPTKRSASSPAKSHQIVRIAPKIFAPFQNIEKPKVSNKPLVGESKSFSGLNKPMIRNTQLRPLPASRPPRPMEMLNQMSGLESISSTSYSGTSGRNVYRGSRNMLNDLDTKIPPSEASPRPYSEIPLRATSLTTYDKGASFDTEYDVPVHNPRPVSETVPPKRMDKIGMGQIMATDSTRERNKYAREIVNSFSKQKIPAPQSAFDEKKEEETIIEHDIGGDNKGKETKHKRHKVFTNSLLKGGYTYDKHSRIDNRDKSNKSKDNQMFDNIAPPSGNNITQASVSQLHLSVSDSASSASVGNKLGESSHYDVPNYGTPMAAPSVSMGGGKFVQSHGHGVMATDANSDGDFNKTADRFKRLRSRRDQEMEWLMKDAAETEV